MSNEISNVLGLNRRPATRVNLGKYMPDVVANRVQNTVEYTQERVSNARESFGKLDTTNKVLIIAGVLFILFMIGLLVKFWRDQKKREKFLSEPLFMTEIDQGEPHDTKKMYRYTDPNTGRTTPYIPNYNFRSDGGSEFTFSYWIRIDGREWNYRFGDWKHIFHRGTSPMMSTTEDGNENEQITKLNSQMPGFWLSPKENTLNCALTTGDSGEERITIEDVPINKWINVVLVVGNNSAALYMDGRLHRTINLINKVVVAQDAVYVNYFGGFGGNMAYLQFFDRALTPKDVDNLYREFRSKTDKHIRDMFEKEDLRTKLPNIVDKQQCNYMAFIKKEKDKEEYIDKILSISNTLCKNTEDMTETECQAKNRRLKQLIDKGLPITELKEKLDKIVSSIEPINEKVYQYIDESGKKHIAHLTSSEYQKIVKK